MYSRIFNMPSSPTRNILVVGKLGYHEENITKWIINELKDKGFNVDRIGGNYDFFIPGNEKNLIQQYFKSTDVNLVLYDAVLFLDFWNMVLPIFNYKKSIENRNCKFFGIIHGSVKFENDVARSITNADHFEAYLLKGYDLLFAPKQFVKDKYFPKDENVVVGNLPVNLQSFRERPILPWKKRLIFPHRFNPDKGRDEFVTFATMYDDIECIVTDKAIGNLKRNNIKFVGRLSQDQLKKLCSEGGYVWSSAYSEIMAYAILDCMSYGLTPVVNLHPAYSFIPDWYKYNSFQEAYGIIISESILDNNTWKDCLKLSTPDRSIASWIKEMT